jgi:hypothetical protein
MSDDYGYGREQIVYVTEESTFGTLVQLAEANAIKVLNCGFNFSQERKDRLEKGSTRSLISRVTGRKAVDWSIEKYILPSGSAGTAPDDESLWEAMFGTETVTPETSVAYTLLAEPAKSLSIFSDLGPHREAICGAVPTKCSIKFGGGEEPKVSFSGEAKDHYLCGSDTLDEAASATDTITVHDASQFAAGMLIKVGDDDNDGSGFTINSVDHDNEQLTLDASVTDEADESAVIPMPFTPTTAGNIIQVIVGTAKFGTTSLYVTDFSLDIDQKVKMRNDEFGYSSARGYRHPEYREATCSLTLYFEKAAAKWLNDAKRFQTQDLEVVLGDTAGSICTINCNQVEFDIPNVDVPDADEATIALTGRCLGSSGEDEVNVVFT